MIVYYLYQARFLLYHQSAFKSQDIKYTAACRI